MSKLRVAVVMGGPSAEREVSIESGQAVLRALATIGHEVDGGIVLSGHTDVVPAAGQPWTSDPFQLRMKTDQQIASREEETPRRP